MHIIYRNLFTKLRIDNFQTQERLEPMSRFKIRKLMAIMKHIADMPAGEIALSNPILNRRLKKIQREEPHAIDTSTETVHVLNIIVHNIETMLNKGVVLRGIVDLGIYLRTMGHKIDFIKLENWLTKLHVETLAQFQGSILIQLLGFDTDEVPFTRRVMTDAKSVTLKAVERTVKDTSYKWDFKQNKSPWVQVNSQAIKQSMRRSFHYLLYAPIETISNLTYKFAKNLSELEE